MLENNTFAQSQELSVMDIQPKQILGKLVKKVL